MVPKLFYELGLTDWNDEAQREEYETAVNRAIRSVLDTRFDFRKPWREQKQKLEAVDAFQKELSKYNRLLHLFLIGVDIKSAKKNAKNISETNV